MEQFKKMLKWSWQHIKLIGILLFGALVFTLCYMWYRKNERIRKLSAALAIAKAKIKLEKLSLKYDTDVEALRELSAKEEKVKLSLKQIGDGLQEKLSPDMTIEEIVAKFKEIGLVHKDVQ